MHMVETSGLLTVKFLKTYHFVFSPFVSLVCVYRCVSNGDFVAHNHMIPNIFSIPLDTMTYIYIIYWQHIVCFHVLTYLLMSNSNSNSK